MGYIYFVWKWKDCNSPRITALLLVQVPMKNRALSPSIRFTNTVLRLAARKMKCCFSHLAPGEVLPCRLRNEAEA
jgi:hypothetical protein